VINNLGHTVDESFRSWELICLLESNRKNLLNSVYLSFREGKTFVSITWLQFALMVKNWSWSLDLRKPKIAEDSILTMTRGDYLLKFWYAWQDVVQASRLSWAICDVDAFRHPPNPQSSYARRIWEIIERLRMLRLWFWLSRQLVGYRDQGAICLFLILIFFCIRKVLQWREIHKS